MGGCLVATPTGERAPRPRRRASPLSREGFSRDGTPSSARRGDGRRRGPLAGVPHRPSSRRIAVFVLSDDRLCLAREPPGLGDVVLEATEVDAPMTAESLAKQDASSEVAISTTSSLGRARSGGRGRRAPAALALGSSAVNHPCRRELCESPGKDCGRRMSLYASRPLSSEPQSAGPHAGGHAP